jgi:hypothetical protein
MRVSLGPQVLIRTRKRSDLSARGGQRVRVWSHTAATLGSWSTCSPFNSPQSLPQLHHSCIPSSQEDPHPEADVTPEQT